MTFKHLLSATETISLIEKQAINVKELMKHHIDLIQSVNPILNSIVTLNSNIQSDFNTTSLLKGLPFTAKDVFDSAGIRTTYGSVHFKDFIPNNNAYIIKKLIKHGGTFLGKTNTPAFGFSFFTENDCFGRSNNPISPRLTVGGSSGADAAAVCGGLVPFSIGSDIAGSLRFPAHCCGVYSLKSTPGLISTQGHHRIGGKLLCEKLSVGFFSRSVQDLEMLWNISKGYNPMDPISLPFSFSIPQKDSFRTAYILFEDIIDLNPTILDAIKTASDYLNVFSKYKSRKLNLGFEKELMDVYLKFLFHASNENNNLIKDLPFVQFFQSYAKNNTKYKIENIFTKSLNWTVFLNMIFEKVDILILPVFPDSPPLATKSKELLSSESFISDMSPNFLAPYLGLPSLTIPMAFSNSSLPFAIQLISQKGTEKHLFSAAKQIEQMMNTSIINKKSFKKISYPKGGYNK